MVCSCKNIEFWKKEGNCMVKLQEMIVFKNVYTFLIEKVSYTSINLVSDRTTQQCFNW